MTTEPGCDDMSQDSLQRYYRATKHLPLDTILVWANGSTTQFARTDLVRSVVCVWDYKKHLKKFFNPWNWAHDDVGSCYWQWAAYPVQPSMTSSKQL